MEYELTPCVDKFNIRMGGCDNLGVTVRGHRKCENGNFLEQSVVIKKGKRTLLLKWNEWVTLLDAKHGVSQAQRQLETMGGVWSSGGVS